MSDALQLHNSEMLVEWVSRERKEEVNTEDELRGVVQFGPGHHARLIAWIQDFP
jgi:hypothetical protein